MWTTEHMLLCPPPINLYPVNTTPLNQHISPPKQHGQTKHKPLGKINVSAVKLLGNARREDNYKISAQVTSAVRAWEKNTSK